MALSRLLLTLLLASFSAGALARQPVYFSLHGGGEEHDVDYQFAGTLPFDPEEDSDVYGLGVGYDINEHWFIQLDYTHADADELEIDQVFLSLNYRAPMLFEGFYLQFGLVAGEGTLEWDDKPDFADAIFDDLKDDEALYGGQIGFGYDLADHWSVGLLYQYFDQEFNTNLETTDFGRLEFEHKNYQAVLFSLRYHL